MIYNEDNYVVLDKNNYVLFESYDFHKAEDYYYYHKDAYKLEVEYSDVPEIETIYTKYENDYNLTLADEMYDEEKMK